MGEFETEVTCPECGHHHTHSANVREMDVEEPPAVPHAGALSFCIACGDVSIFVERGGRLQLDAFDENDLPRRERALISKMRFELSHVRRGEQQS